MKLGIVGLPNVGKSTLFNSLTKAGAAEAANYPFCTIEPNVGIVPVPDKRLGQAVVLLLAEQPDIQEMEKGIQTILEPYYRPKHILVADCIPQTGNGKVNRADCRILAQRLLQLLNDSSC